MMLRNLLLSATALMAVVSEVNALAFTTNHKIRTPHKTTALRMSSIQDLPTEPKVCLVTGASTGIGRAIALELGKCGQKVAVNYIDFPGMEDAANEVVAEVKKLGGDAIAVEADCSKKESVEDMFKKVVDEYGTCDVIVNNAGIARDGLVARMTEEQWQSVIDINLSGVFYCSQAFFKIASKKRTGRIINMASVVGQIGNPGQANYGAAKGGVLALTKCNAKEFASRGITVNCICPGFIKTPMTDKLGEEYLEKVAEGIPLKRLGTPEEVAAMVRFLALEPAAGYITGHHFNVDGGIAIGV